MQHWAHNTHKDDNQSKGTTQQTEGKVNINNPEIQATLGTQHTEGRQ